MENQDLDRGQWIPVTLSLTSVLYLHNTVLLR